MFGTALLIVMLPFYRMLPAATERILTMLPADALMLDVGGWAAPFNRADWIIDLMPYETRGAMGSYGDGPERFTQDTWVMRDICDHEPWPFEDDQFDFALCVTTLEDIRDPIWVCSEMSRVARAGYIEVPTIEAERIYNVLGQGPWLGHEHHRWLVEISGGELVFMHKPHSIHHDWRLRVLPRWRARMSDEDQLQGLFWEREVPVRERFLIGLDYADALEELRERVRRRFEPSPAELRVKQARDVAQHGFNLAKRPVRRAAERLLDRF
jgi:SAM-dependent methyltransferase